MALTEPGVALDAVYPAQPTRVAEIRHDVTIVASTAGADETALLQINLAVSEAATNAILHAYRDGSPTGAIHVLVQHEDDFLDVSIRDNGVGMAPRYDSPGMGIGLCLMAHETYRFEVKSSPHGGTEVVLRFHLEPERAL